MRGFSVEQLTQLLVLLVFLLWPLFQFVVRARSEAAAKAEEAERARVEPAPQSAVVRPRLQLPEARPRPPEIEPVQARPRPVAPAPVERAASRARLRGVFVWMAIFGPPRGSGRDDPTAPPF